MRCTVSSHVVTALRELEVLSCAPGAYGAPGEVAWEGASKGTAPGTVASALRAAKRLDVSAAPDLDAMDHWFRLLLPAALPEGKQVLRFGGLATIADVWLDGQHVLRSESMFGAHELDVSALARAGSELVIRCGALTKELAIKRPRPRYKTRVVDPQQLRFVRTSLLGRMPTLTPRPPVVGPYREIALETRRGFEVLAARCSTSLAGATGRITVALDLAVLGGDVPLEASLVVEGEAGSARFTLKGERMRIEQGGWEDGRKENSNSDLPSSHPPCEILRFTGTFKLPQVKPWWPHTHGSPARSRATIELGDTTIELGHVAFRSLTLDRGVDGSDFGLIVNGERVFCRGACWFADDLALPGATSPEPTLELVARAGMNMLRVVGLAAYESDAFYEACDARGILVWQDFMFANLDYPESDAAFVAAVKDEARRELARFAHRPCLAVLCGNSEVEQQVAFLGMPPELGQNAIFQQHLPEVARELAPDVPYVASSASGGDQPFRADFGPSGYYGVGAYLRPLEDARRASVRFAAECLGFSNVPGRVTIERFLRDLEAPYHTARWKERVPRDRGAGWDFEDVSDHYVRVVFGVDPARVRYADPERYLALSRAAVSTVMETTFAEWRRAGSVTRGGLVWHLKDFWQGAGWGVIDADGLPKAAYYALARSFANVALLTTDEGVNGLRLHAINETERSLEARLEVTLYRAGEREVAAGAREISLLPRSVAALSAEAVLGGFLDVSHAYRFGPPGHDLLVATLREGETILARAFAEPIGVMRAEDLDLGLRGQYERRGDRLYAVVATRRFAQRVSIEVDGHLPDDDFFHLEPGGERRVELRPTGPRGERPRGQLTALNSSTTVTFASAPEQGP